MVPGVTIADWVTMEGGHADMAAYVAHMHQSGVWVDTPMLYAASAVYGMQIICFVGSGDPQAIIAPAVASLPEAPMCTIANVNNVHFFALHPDDREEIVAGPLDSKGDLLCVYSADGAGQDEETEPSEDQWVRGSSAPLATSSNFLVLGSLINVWKPFSTDGMQGELRKMLRHVELDQTTDTMSQCFQTLQWRDAVKLWQWEQKERMEGIDREHTYKLAAQFHESRGIRCGRAKLFGKSRRLLLQLDIRTIVRNMETPCEKRNAAHTCLDVFRAMPQCILRWRQLWYAIPKHDRHQRLVDMFREQRDADVAAHAGPVFLMPHNPKRSALPDRFRMHFVIAMHVWQGLTCHVARL